MTVGVLALQGDVTEHASVLGQLGCSVVELRRERDLEGIEAVVLPGGESTTLGMLLESSGLFGPLSASLDGGMPALGTCAGMILLASEVLDGRPGQPSFGVIDISVRRNAFGRQVESFEADLYFDGPSPGEMHAVFIRAPVVERAGPDVEVLCRIDHAGVSRPVVCRQGPVIVASFHPELTGEDRLHRMLLDEVDARHVEPNARPLSERVGTDPRT